MFSGVDIKFIDSGCIEEREVGYAENRMSQARIAAFLLIKLRKEL